MHHQFFIISHAAVTIALLVGLLLSLYSYWVLYSALCTVVVEILNNNFNWNKIHRQLQELVNKLKYRLSKLWYEIYYTNIKERLLNYLLFFHLQASFSIQLTKLVSIFIYLFYTKTSKNIIIKLRNIVYTNF